MSETSENLTPVDVLIVGGGLAGLCCGKRLSECGVKFRILEGSDGVGGRVRTDLVDGFRLDRGFQIYLTAYPEGRRVLDLDALDLKPFRRGALIWSKGSFHRVVDPREALFSSLLSVFNPIGSIRDKLRTAFLYWDIDHGKLEVQLEKPDQLTLDFLRWKGRFSPKMIDRLFRPFLGGVFLEKELVTSSRFFRFIFRTFANGPGAIPALGMQMIPDQIAAQLPSRSIRCSTKVERIGHREVILSSGESIRCRAVIVATEGSTAAKLLGADVEEMQSNGTVTLYYSANRAPISEPILMLDGEGEGPVNNLVVLSNASPAYAPPGKALMAASIVGIPEQNGAELDQLARKQLWKWFGDEVTEWKLIREYIIPEALPRFSAGSEWQKPVRLRPGLYVCGDHRDNPSIDGAMVSGFRAAQAAMEDLKSELT